MTKKILLLILIPVLLLAGGYIYLRTSLQSTIKKEEKRSGEVLPDIDSLGGKKVAAADLRPLLIKRMQQLLKKSSNGLYDLSVSGLELDVLASTITLQGVTMKPDAIVLDSLKKLQKLPDDVLDVSFDSLRIEGINIDDALTSKTMDYKLLKLIKPVINIRHQKGDVKKEAEEKEDFAQRFLKEMEKLSVKKIVIEEGTVNLYNEAKKSPPVKLNHLTAILDNLQIDSNTRKDKNRFLFATEADISFQGYNRPTPDGLYVMKIGKLRIKAPQDEVTLSDFSFNSPLSKEEFAKKQKLSKELYNLSIPSVSIKNVNWWALLNEEEIVADAVKAQGGKLSIFLDRSLPPKNKTGNFPNQMVMRMPLKLNVVRVDINGLDFSYGEFNPISKQSGTIYIDNIDLAIANLSNIKSNTVKPVTVTGQALFMHQVPVKAEFVFDMANSSSGKFSAHIKADGFDGTLVNSFTAPMGLLKVEKGKLHSAETKVTGNQWQAHGDVFVPYEDLKLTLLEKDKGEKMLDKKGFTSFAANLLLIKNNNPKEGSSSRKASVDFKRIPEGGFFMLIWKTMLSGILKTIGAPQKIATKTIASQAKQ